MTFEEWWLQANEGADTKDKDAKYPMVKELAKVAWEARGEVDASLADSYDTGKKFDYACYEQGYEEAASEIAEAIRRME